MRSVDVAPLGLGFVASFSQRLRAGLMNAALRAFPAPVVDELAAF
jgi:hypothetical protein